MLSLALPLGRLLRPDIRRTSSTPPRQMHRYWLRAWHGSAAHDAGAAVGGGQRLASVPGAKKATSFGAFCCCCLHVLRVATMPKYDFLMLGRGRPWRCTLYQCRTSNAEKCYRRLMHQFDYQYLSLCFTFDTSLRAGRYAGCQALLPPFILLLICFR